MSSPFVFPLAGVAKYMINGIIQITPELGSNYNVAGAASNATNDHVHATPSITIRDNNGELFAGAIAPVQVRATLAQAWTSVPLTDDDTITIDFLMSDGAGGLVTRSIELNAANTTDGQPIALVLSDIIPAAGIIAIQWSKGGASFAGDHTTIATLIVEEV